MSAGKRVVLYGRTSHDKRKGKPVDDQLADLRTWARQNNRTVVAELRDDGISASRFAHKTRPDWQRAMEIISSGGAEELAVWEISRNTRDRAVWAALAAALIEVHAMLVVDGKVHDPADPDDGFMLDLGMALAVRESAMTSKRTLRGARHGAAAGRPHGPVAYGLRVVYDETTGKPKERVLDDEKAAVVREAARRILAGETPTTVAHDLNRRGILTATGKQWIGNNLLRTIAAPVMAGLSVHRGQVVDGVTGAWPAILTVEQHQRLQEVLTDPTRRTHRNGAHVRHLIVGIGRCDVCGGPLRTLTRKRRTDIAVVYGCKHRYCVSRNAAEVDEFVEKVVIGLLARPDFAEQLAARSRDPELLVAIQEAARLRAKLDEARRLVDDDRLSLESLADLEARTMPKLRAAEHRARPRHIPDIVYATAGADAAARWLATPIAARREIVRVLMDVRVARADRRGRFSPFDPTTVKITPKVIR